ncbi:SymE family type I addiction module toxin [Chitinophaga sp. MM2321]|uniref:SymE family type I addiction module toxin n=1 Tax=Chitinophaga sp. MM2321 TaxID=3137178 RepID=UPI0032D598B6
MKSIKKTRNLTVKYVYQERAYNSKALPLISLAGLWLQNAGFEIGDNIAVSVERNKLVIKIATKAPKQEEYEEYMED